MELGEKILAARQAAGLSQRQLCGDTITRNMLSQIEHGTAKPSMATLKILAERLGKPMSYFLEEEAAVSPNQAVMERAQWAWDAGEYAGIPEILAAYQSPDPIFDREYDLLMTLARLNMAEKALAEGRLPYAGTLLSGVEAIPYGIPELAKKKALLEAKLTGDCTKLPSLDEELFLRAKAAFDGGQWSRCLHLLEAMEDRTSAVWHLLKGDLFVKQAQWQLAAECFHRAEASLPEDTASRLEECYRELGDFKQAYFYACRRREG